MRKEKCCSLVRGSTIAKILQVPFHIKLEPDTNLTILLTHMHLDHLIGGLFFSALPEKSRQIHLYAAERLGATLQETLDRIISPPFWPVKISYYPAEAIFHTLPLIDGDVAATHSFSVGNVEVSMMEGVHPGGYTIFRLTFEGVSLLV